MRTRHDQKLSSDGGPGQQRRRRSPARIASILGIAFALWILTASCGGRGSDGTSVPTLSVLVFSHTTGFRHGSIAAGIDAVHALGENRGWRVDATEDPTVFNAANLLPYDVVVWLNTTGDVLNGDQELAFQTYIESGGGYVGIHSAADTEYSWPFYGELVGAYFDNHPATQQATIQIEDSFHPATAGLPTTWVRTDEWYNFRTNPRSNVRVLATILESTYTGGTMGSDHPIIWSHDQGSGRAFYSGLGHTPESYSEPLVLDLIAGAISWAGGATD